MIPTVFLDELILANKFFVKAMAAADQYPHFGNFDDLLRQLNAVSKETMEPPIGVKQK
jgi:hypothetical protein